MKPGTATVGLAVTVSLTMFACWITWWLTRDRDLADLYRFSVGACVGLVCGFITGTLWVTLTRDDES